MSFYLFEIKISIAKVPLNAEKVRRLNAVLDPQSFFLSFPLTRLLEVIVSSIVLKHDHVINFRNKVLLCLSRLKEVWGCRSYCGWNMSPSPISKHFSFSDEIILLKLFLLLPILLILFLLHMLEHVCHGHVHLVLSVWS